MSDNRLAGKSAEAVAAEYLRKKGHQIISLNYISRYGEVDIISKDRDCLVFSEVKSRKDKRFAAGREYVTRSKQEKIIKSAAMYIAREGWDMDVRFDVLEVYTGNGLEIEHIENAFE